MPDIRQIIIVRKDLHMRAGKIASQVSHASIKVILDMMYTKVINDEWIRLELPLREKDPIYKWLNGQFTKIVLYVDSLEEMKEIEGKANKLGIPNALIIDAGKTEFHNVPTPTCLALGPYDSDILAELTGHLKLV